MVGSGLLSTIHLNSLAFVGLSGMITTDSGGSEIR